MTLKPTKLCTSGNYACTTGKAILRAYNSTCGNSLLNVNLGAGVLSKVVVNKEAQKTNAYQSNNNILVSDKATINSKPQLEIFADDVKCSHGCTVGQLEE